MKQRSIIFNKPYEVDIHIQPVPAIEKNKVLVKTKWSAISQGSEMLVYKGLVPAGWPIDSTIQCLSGTFQYPVKYGYTAVGEVVAVGPGVKDEWLGRSVFAFHPHASHFLAKTEELISIPPEIDATAALFLPNMETAVNLLMDGAPIIGECVMVFGQGVVGLLTTALLSKFPLSLLITLDRYPLRRQKSLELGAHRSIDPVDKHIRSRVSEVLKSVANQGSADLVYELSGEPSALELAIAAAGFDARIVIGSWYGTKKAALELGQDFHRNRIRLVSSQVSTIAPGFTGRWTKSRRLDTVWKMIGLFKPERFITHRFAVDQVKQAFELLDKKPQEAIQVVLSYDE
jgi:2-desacetyl-2-hydroxyethyl bacteriochlorophyllide A dehydrogenase